MNTALIEGVDGNVAVRASSIPGAGAGLFYCGDVPIDPGKLLICYGGTPDLGAHLHDCDYDYKRSIWQHHGGKWKHTVVDGRDDSGCLLAIRNRNTGINSNTITFTSKTLFNMTPRDWKMFTAEYTGVQWVPGVYDNVCNTTNLSRFINDSCGNFLNAMAGGGNCIVTRVRIYPGDELFCDYGVSYWKSKGLRKSELQKPKPCVALPYYRTADRRRARIHSIV